MNEVVGVNPKFLEALERAKRVSKSTASVLLFGESGTGKDVFAHYIHCHSRQSQGPFTAINCASIPDQLLESELFGHAKGAFTGALEHRVGLFEAAENGTLFLDEIGDLSLSLQAKLLRVLQERTIRRVGENRDRNINCRLISATHKDLSIEINESRFREDLFFRLNVVPITIPPLRDRPEDLILLAETFLRRFVLANESSVRTFSKEAIAFLLANQWKGNVRELENAVERAVVMCSGSEISLEHFCCLEAARSDSNVPSSIIPEEGNTFSFRYLRHLPSLNEVINRYIAYAVQKNAGARDRAARDIGIDRKTLYRRMQANDAPPPVKRRTFILEGY
jgi:two-component system, NtrC family, response regulator HydG